MVENKTATRRFKFSSGRLILSDGRLDEPEIAIECMSSNGTTVYTAIRWRVASAEAAAKDPPEEPWGSCNCPGWAFKKGCKHSRQVARATVPAQVPRQIATGGILDTTEHGRGIHFDEED